MNTPFSFKIRVGVTGHRSIQDNELLRNQIKEAFCSITKTISVFPDLVIEHELVSALAEGADRIVAEEFLKLNLGKLRVLLPFAEEEYCATFNSPESIKHYESIRSKATQINYWKKISIKEVYDDANFEYAKNIAYEGNGQLMVDTTDVIIAIWNMKPAQGRGGTAEIVAYSEMWNKPIIIINTSSNNKLESRGLDTLKNNLKNTRNIFTHYERLDEFTKQMEKDRKFLFPKALGNLSETVEKKTNPQLLYYYSKAEQLALSHQRVYYNNSLWTFILALIAVVIISVGISFFTKDQHSIFFLGEGLVLLLILAISKTPSISKAQTCWLEFRYLAECIRIAIYSDLCGLELDARDFLPHHRGVDNIQYNSIRMLDYVFSDSKETRSNLSIDGMRKLIHTAWVGGQEEYHINRLFRNQKKDDIIKNYGVIVFFIALLAAFSHFMFPHTNIILTNILIFLAFVLPSVGAILEGIRAHMEYRYTSYISRKMLSKLCKVEEEIIQKISETDFKTLIRKVRDLMITEVNDWLDIVLTKEIEPRA